MSIRQIDRAFILETEHTSYIFHILDTGHAEHLYYGRRVRIGEQGQGLEALTEKRAFIQGNTNSYDSAHENLTLENICLEMSSYGKGDIREPFIEVIHGDGSYTSDFLFRDAVITGEKPEYRTLPGSYSEDGVAEHLCVTLEDAGYGLKLELHYYVYPDCDVIARSCRLINDSEEMVQVCRLMSLQLDLADTGYVMSTFTGAWAREMHRTDIPLESGIYGNTSYTGTTSSRANSFVMLSRRETTEDAGECMGFHLIYSGNHYEAAEVSPYGKTRLVTGINPRSFSWNLEPGEDLEAPEAFFTWSGQGFNGMSGQLHRFIREHIVRGQWKKKERPVLLNSWEAAYFDINEAKLLKLAKAGKNVGVELFVMDDGWFGEREDDTSSLGDWQENRKKLPGGVAGLAGKIRELGMDFGIWVEPEMVNVKSGLYQEHPDWTMEIPGHAHSEGRHQRLLDLANPQVQDYVIDSMSKVFASGEISYVKWDMNRTFTDYYAPSLPTERQGEVAHRYVLGLYRCMKELTVRFPHILFEGCSAGGNRFDPGILCYFPQIWASDNTDALCRAQMQHNYSYGYPLSVLGAHVSGCPNHQTLRRTPLETRFGVAAFGLCGYECNLCDMTGEQLEAIRQQIALYKQWRGVLQQGSFYRGRGMGNGGREGFSALRASDANVLEWTCVSADRKRAVGLLMQQLAVPNTTTEVYHARGLEPDVMYHFYGRKLQYNVKDFGDLVNTVAPIHIRQDSMVHNLVAKFVKMDGETEDLTASGDVLMYGGVKLKSAFAATGYDENVRYFPDFGCRMYFMEREE